MVEEFQRKEVVIVKEIVGNCDAGVDDKKVVCSRKLKSGIVVRVVKYSEEGALYMLEIKKPEDEGFELFSMLTNEKQAHLLFKHFVEVSRVYEVMMGCSMSDRVPVR